MYLITTTIKAGVYTGIQNYHEKLTSSGNHSVKPQYNIATNNYHRGLIAACIPTLNFSDSSR